MTLNRVAETILTSCLLLSRVWTRPSDVVCDGGRGEGDKWFDGCRWCVCQQSGASCSSSECSHLVSKVAPCHKVDSRWWDGCYHCKCYHHGIDCTVDDTCLLLMRSERYGRDFLSHDACLNAQDGRCVCGIDGVPSCTAEVIDRNAHPATTVRLNSVFPTASSIISPRHVYYNQPYTHSRGFRNDRPGFYSDSLYINHPDGTIETLNNGQLKKHVHSLVKRHTSRNKKHSPQVYITTRRRSQNNKHKSAVSTHKSSSHNSRNSRKHFENSLSGRGSRGRRKKTDTIRDDPDSVFDTGLIISNDGSQFYPNIKWRDTSSRKGLSGSNIKMYKNTHKDYYETVPGGKREELKELLGLTSRDADEKFQKRTEPLREDSLEGKYFNDEAVVENLANDILPSLLIVSGNRCRWGVRWYGGSLRCYCGMDNSITCGDPSFVASRIDGFRLERASCEVGQAWDDTNACRACECLIKGVVLCTRSPSCPLPFLIKPLPLHPDEERHFDRKDDYGDGKGQSSIGHTDEFTGQEVHKVVFDNDTSEGDVDKGITEEKESHLENDVYIDKEGANLTVVDFTDGKIKDDSKLDVPNRITTSKNDSEKTGNKNGNTEVNSKNNNVETGRGDDSTDGENKKEDNVVRLNNGTARHPDSVIPQEDTSTAGDVNINLGEDVVGKGGEEISEDLANNKLGNIGNNDFKRTTQVIVGECKPLHRWLEGCTRCRCDKDGKKHCSDSRCLKPISVIPGLINTSSDNGDKRHNRPMQRPPPALFLSRDGPINLQPPFLGTSLCGRFTVGQKYWDECNICLCTPHGPKCTAKNCA
ncbi:hypothetical protein BsWGS_02500 [Bradybaena similaris]